MDKLGRVLIPKSIREMLGLRPGVTLRINVSDEGLELKVAEPAEILVEQNGLLVHRGSASSNLIDEIKQVREERSAQLMLDPTNKRSKS